jgi:hypothetical protein
MHTNPASKLPKQGIEIALKHELTEAAKEVSLLLRQGKIPKSTDQDFFWDIERSELSQELNDVQTSTTNCFYSVSAFFSGFVISFIDSVPSEVAVLSIRKLDVLAQGDRNRTSEATAAVSIDWLQIDNHCPNAPFPVVLSPESHISHEEETLDDNINVENPFIGIGVVIAPSHKSNIMVCFLLFHSLS